jgi:hypothetical protein
MGPDVWLFDFIRVVVLVFNSIITTRPRITNETNIREDTCTIERSEDTSMDYATFVNIAGKKKV